MPWFAEGMCMLRPIILLACLVAAIVASASARAQSGMRIERDLAYGSDPAQRLDVYRPEKAEGAPVLLMVHGGAWRIGDKSNRAVVDNKVAHWVPKGFIFVSVNYRMLPGADPKLQADDVAEALAFAQSKAASWGGDPARFVLMGHSAGAHLVALLAADPEPIYKGGVKPWLGTVALDSAALDVVTVMENAHRRLYDRAFGADPAYWRDVSPLHRLTGKPQPMLLVCSSLRKLACPNAEAFAAKARAAGGRAELLPVDLRHRQVNIRTGEANALTAAIDAFLETVLQR
jgi:acetyl esterase/lipase